MANHYHLVLGITKANLSEGMKELNHRYASMFNNLHDRGGHVFQGRFYSRIVTSDTYMMELVRYIMLNPVRAGLVEHPASWPWNCYSEFLADTPTEGIISNELTLSLFSRDIVSAKSAFEEYLEAACDKAFPWELVRDFLDGKTQECAPKKSLSTIFSDPQGQKNKQIADAYYSCGYKQREIAEFLGTSIAGVHRALKAAACAGK